MKHRDTQELVRELRQFHHFEAAKRLEELSRALEMDGRCDPIVWMLPRPNETNPLR